MNRLVGQPCLVLRPTPDGERLCAALGELGLDVRHFPSLEIRPLVAVIPPAEVANIVIFISRNAVRHGTAVLAAAPGATIGAIGAGTAAELRAAGHPPELVPQDGYDSEALLAAPGLAEVAGRQIWIVRGRGGRALLGETLARRGAHVRYIEVYERRIAQPDAAVLRDLRALLTGAGPPWLVATSVESLAALHTLLGGEPLCYGLVTASDRVVKLARERDRVARVLRASGPDVSALRACLQAWSRRPPPAPDSA
ncbi:MAG: uroporphyrinogen-III synthase [Gammaproteobacteria bacterium]|nr:uroporphyrinogen-III synthase [Gammaproteobacteria bacterium]TVQ50347.1 MAG: uroporphyrinogen-III synthase [Gammaproteobacteria bacterium]